jgi:hypothetical protein
MNNIFCFGKNHNKSKSKSFLARSKILMTNDKPIKMLSRIHILLLSVAILLPLSMSCQTVERTITWDKVEKTYVTAKGIKVKMVSFAGALTDDKNDFLPVYEENIRLSQYGSITATLSDEVYEALTTADVTSNKIDASIKIKAVPGMMRKIPYAIVTLVPLRKNPLTGQIEKLVRYTLKIEVTPTQAHQYKKLQSYANGSVLATGTWYKAGVVNTGVYKLDYNYLKNTCGFDLSNTSFSSIAVFGNGGGMIPELNAVARYDDLQENPTYIVDNNNNNRVDQGDYILFYGQGPDQWTFDSTNALFTFTKNLYSDTNYYFITADRGTGKRIPTIPSASGATHTISQFDDYAAHEVDKYNFLNSGKQWVGDLMSTLNPTVTINFSFPNLVRSSPIKYSSMSVMSSPYNSTITTSLNGSQVFAQNIGSTTSRASDYPNVFDVATPQIATGTFSAASDNFSLTYNFVNPDASGSSFGYIYFVTLNAKRALTFTGNSMLFRSIASVGTGRVSQFDLANATGTTHIWDVSDITTVQEILNTSNSGILSFTAPTPAMKEFIAVDVNGSFANPIGIQKVGLQNLHAIGQPNMLIITPDDMLGASTDLAAFHSQNDRLSVKVATLSQIYNEFGSGRRDISAIRDFIRMVYDKAGNDSSRIPRYVLLMGDGSFDPKDRVVDNNNQFPTYESPYSQNILDSYTTDDFFGCLDINEGGDMGSAQQLDVSIGRLPAANANEAQGMVEKIKLYKSSTTLASWRNIVTFVSDEPFDKSPSNEFEGDADGLAESIRIHYPAYNVSKIYCDAYQRIATPGGARYPDVNTAILNQINTGTLIISYTGHGGVSNWANARIFNLSDIQNLQNHEKLPAFVTATCEFSRFDDPTKKSAGEFLITSAVGGAIAMITTVRPVYEDANTTLQTATYPFFFNQYQGHTPTVGEVMMQTKNAVIASTGINAREFVLLGDPAMTLDYPQYNVVTTKVDNVPVTQPHDTLKALKYVTISGEVRNFAGVKMTSFNGTCFPLIYDKLGVYYTLQNDPGYAKFPYNAYKSTLFKGQCSVINGAFSFSFIVPKDINYAVGYGRISYYADNGTIDAGGYQNDITIGGASDSAITSKVGPVIKLFMNDEKFVYGGITDANPRLLAELSDPYGINTTGNGLGHDLTCVLDANTQNPIVLNNYYQTALNNFRKGTVVYPFTSLSTGSHTLKVKAWDILNNSSEDNTEFIVASSAKLALQHLFNYPNPFTTHTQFMFEHNRPGEELNVMIQIFSVSGKLIKTIQQDIVSVGYRVDNVRWDGLDDYGDKIGRGVYVYKVHVRDAEGNTANQFQKLVVLR